MQENSDWLWLLGLLVVAFFGVFCSHVSARILASHVRKEQTRQKAVENIEHFCDELLNTTIGYWSVDNSPDNADEMATLNHKISAYNTIITRSIKEGFLETNELKLIIKSMADETTGEKFGKNNKKANQQIVARATGAIIALRMAIRKARYTEKQGR